MTRTGWLVILTALALGSVGSAMAQEPKVGNDWYEDTVDYGFKIKVPKDWGLIPPQPNEPNVLASYSASFNSQIMIGGQGAALPIHMALLRFDSRPERKNSKTIKLGGQTVEYTVPPSTDVHKWLKERIAYGVNWRFDSEKYPKPLKVKGSEEAQYWVYEGNHRAESEVTISAYVAEFSLEPNVKICLYGSGPGDKKWRDYESAWSKMAASFARVAVEEVAVDPAAAMGSPRAKKRADLQRTVASQAGWRLLETENYFILTNDDDEGFLEELMVRLEAIRSVYSEHYPPEKARAIVKKPKKEKEGEKGEERPAAGGEGEGKKEEDGSVTALDPVEASRMSVLRVCRDEQTYFAYGGPGGSAGYWNWVDEELVIYDDKAGGGRNDTWITLNHEAFHQYIHYFYGEIDIHSWYNEGTGDFYSGYQLKHSRFVLGTNSWRETTVQGMLREGPTTKEGRKRGEGYVPLKEFVTWSQGQYYGNNSYDVGGIECYAQGWSLAYFLRTGAKSKAKGWRPEWDKILDTYLETLATTGDLDEAVDKAFPFGDAEWEAFENAWKSYILSI